MKEIVLGTIGSGFIVHNMLKNVLLTEGIRVGAVYSRSEEKGRALAEQYGADRVYTDMAAFLADQETDLIYIASPNSLHYSQAKAALLAGKNVLLEKPFCPRLEEARELVRIARERGLILIDSVPPSYLPNYDFALQELPKIGRIRLCISNFSQYSSRYDAFLSGKKPNVFTTEFAGGSLMDINFYNIFLNVAYFGKPKDIVYHANLQDGIDTSGVLVMQYDDFVSQAAGAKDTWGVNFFQIEGEKGYIYIKDGSSGFTEVRVVTKEGEQVYNAQSRDDRWFYHIQNLTKILLAGDYETLDRRLDLMLDVIETLEKARKSAGITFPGDE